MFNDGCGLIGRCKIGERETTEYTVVEMVIEGIWQRKIHLCHEIDQLLLLHRKGDILDYDCSRYKLLVKICAVVILAQLKSSQG